MYVCDRARIRSDDEEMKPVPKLKFARARVWRLFVCVHFTIKNKTTSQSMLFDTWVVDVDADAKEKTKDKKN